MATKALFATLEKTLHDIGHYGIRNRDYTLYKAVVSKVERTLIETALETTFGNQIKAAKLLGLNRNTLRSKIKKLGLDADRWKI